VIAVSLRGGLGNQLFEYAAGRSLALRHGAELVLDLSELAAATTPRTYALEPFGLPARTVADVRSYEPAPAGSSLRVRLGAWRHGRGSTLTVLRQKGFAFQDEYFAAPDDTHLVGYWQSERYFAEYAHVIREELARTPRADGPAARALAEVSAAGAASVSVHVRRGDYVADAATNRYHGTLEAEWYRAALAAVEERTGPLRAFVFSDDLNWCRRHLCLSCPVGYVDAGSPADDLLAMSRCVHHVVANSSFSWWGAWLGEGLDSVVVAPRRWVRDESIDTRYVVPERWLRL
jgi:hypothetical protein